ncbi:HAD family hydrolase [Leifsonia shinshuensis]|uniref:HAD family hydrolase n=1 Tax=Leifsonia shinshuensis TaxID=150026 RepID=UPI00285C063E|nr:HAD family hydrolase [Leifsonia shinshuensis]MDR6973194.1 putative hydrolase of the HAD superfamily [Leifsonia shinshuensis]
MTAATPPRVVLFDLDDTLFAHRAAVESGILRYAETLGAPYGALEAEELTSIWHDLEEEHYHSYLAGRLDFEGQRQARARDFAARHGVALTDEQASAWFADYFEHYVAAWSLHDDTTAALDALERAIPGVRFGLITNGDLAFQRRKVEAVGLDARMEHLIASGELGVAKPDPAIFRAACAAFGVTEAEAAYVGDRLRTDAIGAAQAGLTGVWLNRRDAVPSPEDERDAMLAGVRTIRSLDELAPLLA